MKQVKRIIVILLSTVFAFLGVAGLLYLVINWKNFLALITSGTLTGIVVLIIPALVAGGVMVYLWTLGKKS